MGAGRDGIALDALLGSAPGAINSSTTNINDQVPGGSTTFASIMATRALNLTDVPSLVPVRATALPGATLPVYGRYTGGFSAYDPNFRTPYTQNITLSVTRSVRRNMSVDVRYVGTFGRKLQGTVNVNNASVFDNPELLDALNVTRAGGNSPLFDQMFAGLNISSVTTGYGAVGTCVVQAAGSTAPGLGKEGCAANAVMQHGSAQLRRNAAYAASLANGNYVALINAIGNTSTASSGLQPLPTGLNGVSARLLRNGCDRLANGVTNIATRCFPEDYFFASPQFTNAGLNFIGNLSHNNYHSLQLQHTLRPTQGISVQSTYTWQKLLTDRYSTYVDVRNRNADYSLDYASVPHEFRTNGTFELPMGPNRFLLGNASGWIARTLERWQVSFIYNYSTGAPRDTFTAQTLYAGGGGNQPQARPDIVGPWINPKTNYLWNGPNNNTGTIFGYPSPYITFPDPQCTNNVGALDSMGLNLQTTCTLRSMALKVPAGTAGAILMPDGVTYGLPVLQTPLPGRQGNQGARMLRLPGRWTLDGNLSKSFRIQESKNLQIRFDATNILNHPNPGEPTYNVQSDNFGQVTTRQGAPRSFQGQLRLSF